MIANSPCEIPISTPYPWRSPGHGRSPQTGKWRRLHRPVMCQTGHIALPREHARAAFLNNTADFECAWPRAKPVDRIRPPPHRDPRRGGERTPAVQPHSGFARCGAGNPRAAPRSTQIGPRSGIPGVPFESSAGRPGIAGRRFGIDPWPFNSCCPFRALPMGGAFPGAASRVPSDSPRAILGRPFRAERMGDTLLPCRGCPSDPPCRGSPPWLPIRSERGHVVAPRTNAVPKGRKKIAPGFNPGISVAPTSSPVGTTESALGRRCIWDHIRSRAA